MKEKNKKILIIFSLMLIFIVSLYTLKIIDYNSTNNLKEITINLNDYSEDIIINKKGIYNLSGTLNHSILINSNNKVILNLKGVNITSNETSSIANINTNELEINIYENNILKDNGKSEYDGCIYSKGKLTINGTGILNIYGNQKNGEGIATTDNDIVINGGKINIESKDDGINIGGTKGIITINDGTINIKANGDGIDSNGSLIINGGNLYVIGSPKKSDAAIDTNNEFIINGGNVIALGSDMLQNPNETSNQKYISFDMLNKVEQGSKISLKTNNEEIINFIANSEFKTLIISNSKLKNEIYDLYINDEKTEHSFEVK